MTYQHVTKWLGADRSLTVAAMPVRGEFTSDECTGKPAAVDPQESFLILRAGKKGIRGSLMKRISGCVLATDTNSGIPNLIVTAYDSEKSIRDILGGERLQGALSVTDLGKRIGSVLTDQTRSFVLEGEDLEFPGNPRRFRRFA
jgi:hypothetical protein